MKHAIYAATASVLFAAGNAAAQPGSAEVVNPVMVLNHNSGQSDKLKRTTQSCVELAQAGRYEDAMPFCNTAIRYAESGAPGASPETMQIAAIARTNRAVVSWLMGRNERAAADLAVAALQSPGATFVQKNQVAMGFEPPASTLAGGTSD
jgi:hypothetical protein